MTYVIPPERGDYGTDSEFLNAVERTAMNMVKAVDCCNSELQKSKQPELMTPTIRVCGFSSGQFSGNVQPRKVAAAIERGIMKQMTAKDYHHTIKKIEYENGSGNLFDGSGIDSSASPSPHSTDSKKSVTEPITSPLASYSSDMLVIKADLDPTPGTPISESEKRKLIKQAQQDTLEAKKLLATPLKAGIFSIPNNEEIKTIASSETDAALDPLNTLQQGEVLKYKMGERVYYKSVHDAYQELKLTGQITCPGTPQPVYIHSGPQPPGSMTVTLNKTIKLAGHESYPTFIIDYNFPRGTQTAKHPNPGSPFAGVKRRTYIPASPEGCKVMAMMIQAWERKLLFRVGTSTTSGKENVVTWNDIHLKTSTTGGPTKYGYPDPTYLSRVSGELGAKTITPETIKGMDISQLPPDVITKLKPFVDSGKTVNPSHYAKDSEKKAAEHFCFRRSNKTHDTTTIYQQAKILRKLPPGTYIKVTKEKRNGGAGTLGFEIAQNASKGKIGIMVAANSGLPGGDIGHIVRGTKHAPPGKPDLTIKHYMNHGGQEENMVANWALSTHPDDLAKQKALIQDTIMNQWGLTDKDSTTNFQTRQGVDYVNSQEASDYADAWVVDNARLSAVDGQKKSYAVNPKKDYKACLLFGAGPNVSNGGSRKGARQRTRNQKAVKNYEFFKKCIKESLKAKFDAGIASGVTDIIFDKTSCGIYAGDREDPNNYIKQINREYKSLVEEVLNEKVGPHGERRGEYVNQAVIADLG